MKTRKLDSTVLAVLRAPYWRQAEAEQALAAWAASGLSLRAFSRRHKTSLWRLKRWQRRLGSEAWPVFHRVQIVEGAERQPARDAAEVELVLAGGRRVAVRSGFDPRALEELVRVVESWSC